jgi:hypothetical protein
MNRWPGATDGTGLTWNASHRTPNQSVFAGASNLSKAIIMTNRKCIYVR